MKKNKTFYANLFENIFELNSKNKIGASTIAVFTFVLYKCEDLQKEIVLSDYQVARELGLSRQTVITAKNKLKLLGILDYNMCRGFPNRFILKGKELPKTIAKMEEIEKNPIEELLNISEPKIEVSHSSSKYPDLKQFMDFAKTLEGYSEKLDDLLIRKFRQWNEADWKTVLGNPILNWQIVLQKNLPLLESTLSFNESNSPPKIPNIVRPKPD